MTKTSTDTPSLWLIRVASGGLSEIGRTLAARSIGWEGQTISPISNIPRD